MSWATMVFSGKIKESAAATKTFAALRIDRRVLSTPTRTVAIANIATVSTGTHVVHRPTAVYWLFALLFLLMTFASMRPDFTWGPLEPTGGSLILGFLTIVFAGIALRPDDKTHYLLISSADGVLSRFTAPDRSILDEVRAILADKINRNDEAMTFDVNFELGRIENFSGSPDAGMSSSGSGAEHGPQPRQIAQQPRGANGGAPLERPAQPSAPRQRMNGADNGVSTRGRGAQPTLAPKANGGPSLATAHAPAPENFIDYTGVLPAVVEMHRFYARQTGTQHLEQRLSELELLMRAGTPTGTQKARLRELSTEMSQILGAYPQAVELFDHIGSLA
jgi:hypothetical protein